jgi:hypothetical protein
MLKPIQAALSCAAVFAITSCATMKNTASATGRAISSFSFASLIPGHGNVKVVKAREKDLKELPTGKERALAYNSERRSGFWIFGGPVDFKEPNLPDSASELDGTLLPPRPH